MPNPILIPRIAFSQPSGAVLPVFGGQVLWLKADALTLNNNDAVSSWTDSSGNGKDHAQASGTKQPTFKTNQQNGKPGVSFDGTNDDLVSASVPTTALVYSIFTVQKFTSAAGLQGLWRNGDGDGWGVYDNVGTRAILHRAVASLNDAAATTNAEIWSAVRTSAPLAKFWVNGANQTISNSTSVPNAPSAFAILGAFSEALGFYFGGLVFEVIVYDNALSDTDRGAVETYLNTKYAIF